MDEQQLFVLLRKYSQGTCNAEELQALEAWYASLGQQLPDEVIDPGSDAAQQLVAQQLRALRAQLQPLQVVRRRPWQKWWRYAAVLAVLLVAGGSGYYLLKPGAHAPQQRVSSDAGKAADFSRYLTLPDGSSVVLHAGSRLIYPDVFGSKREVTLYGEAYFDIRADSLKPFIITSGKLKTTVLGTAFNISAYPGQKEITVSVTRGKVRVEDDRKVLAVLNPDQQIVYNTEDASAQQQQVNALARSSWTTNDMIFENATFETIANTLSKRYEVNIAFSDEALKQCPIRVSFSGTESLEEVLDVVCAVRNATYTIDKGDVMIKGKGCQ
ncbi:FecR family protein [Chitinophaga vietnamensis]|uniref:FecR family protein n=1 Tax=Chitinophaga vietnamensis TaxID=2593957 RepID=UPI0011784CDE|nr:FecR family protein [Chitinophaga vietnamensis]